MSGTVRSTSLKPVGLAGSSLDDQYSDYDYSYYRSQPTTVEQQNIDNLDNKGAYDFSGITPKSNGLTSEGWGDKFSRWFTPNEKGTSLGGQVLSGIGTGVDAASGLAGLYFAQKNFDLAKDAADLEKKKQVSLMARQDKVDQAGVDLSKNVGNGASYNYRTTV